MKTQDQNSLDVQTTPSAPPLRAKSWLASVGAVLAVTLIVGLSATVFTLWKAHRGSGAVVPPSGQWVQVLNGYTVTSLVAPRSNPAVLYACATHVQSSTGKSGQPPTGDGTGIVYTVLRSSDFGSHWQDVGGALSGGCQLAVNPADSNELYAVGGVEGVSSNRQVAHAVLQHSMDGGHTWTTIVPTLRLAGQQYAWNVQQISVEGNHLFGVQWIPAAFPPPLRKNSTPMVEIALSLTRLVESVDGGHTWTTIDSRFNATAQGARDYAIDPSDPKTIYEIVGTSWGPISPVHPIVPTKPQSEDVVRSYGGNEELYKTTDGGTTWQLLLRDLHFGSSVQLASARPNRVYVGSTIRFMPIEASGSQYSADQPRVYPYGRPYLRVSDDGGAHWREVIEQARLVYVQHWFASADGLLYTSSSLVVGNPSDGSVPAQGSSIQRYDPATDKWSDVTKPPVDGVFLAVTSTDGQGRSALWVMGFNDGKVGLYRYVV